MIHDVIGGNPPIVNFIMFLAVFSMLSLIYQTAHTYNKSFVGHDIIPVVLDALNVLLFFAAAVALAAYLKVNNCADKVCTLPRVHIGDIETRITNLSPVLR